MRGRGRESSDVMLDEDSNDNGCATNTGATERKGWGGVAWGMLTSMSTCATNARAMQCESVGVASDYFQEGQAVASHWSMLIKACGHMSCQKNARAWCLGDQFILQFATPP